MTATLHPYPVYKPSGAPWLGVVPERWEVRRLKYAAAIVAGQSPSSVDVYEYGDTFPFLQGNAEFGLRNPTPRLACEKVAKWADAGDILLSVRAPVGAINIADQVYGIGRGLCAITPGSYLTNRFTYFSLMIAKRDLSLVATGSTYDAVTVGDVGGLPFPLPPLPEQASIVRYLDHADRRIWRYVSAKRKLIALLEEEKQAVINRAVTRGLDSNVRLEPSGVEWLDDVPEHWEVRRGKRLFSPRRELARPDDIQLSATQAYGVIPRDEYEERTGRRIVKISLHLNQRRHVEVDDFVISMRSFQGGLERAWASGCIRSSYIVLRPAIEVDVEFFSYVFKSQAYIQALRSTANFIRDGQDLTFDNFCAVDLPFPPAEEKRKIAVALREATADISAGIARACRQIELVQEYRTRLIADVVTGKLDVREAAAQLVEEDDEEAPIDGDGLMADNMDEELYDAEESESVSHSEA